MSKSEQSQEEISKKFNEAAANGDIDTLTNIFLEFCKPMVNPYAKGPQELGHVDDKEKREAMVCAALPIAAANGHSAVVDLFFKWVTREEVLKEAIPAAFKAAALKDHFEVVCLLFPKMPQAELDNFGRDYKTWETIYENLQLQIFDYLFARRSNEQQQDIIRKGSFFSPKFISDAVFFTQIKFGVDWYDFSRIREGLNKAIMNSDFTQLPLPEDPNEEMEAIIFNRVVKFLSQGDHLSQLLAAKEEKKEEKNSKELTPNERIKQEQQARKEQYLARQERLVKIIVDQCAALQKERSDEKERIIKEALDTKARAEKARPIATDILAFNDLLPDKTYKPSSSVEKIESITGVKLVNKERS
jgi:hypothetical protein